MKQVLLGLFLLLALTHCGGSIVTVKTLTDDGAPALNADLKGARGNLPIDELKLSEELEGVKRVEVHDYLRMEPENPDVMTSFKLGPEDKVRVDFFAAPEMSGEREVLPDGYINLPLVGKIKASGLTIEELAHKILKIMVEQKMLNNPDVYVSLIEIKSRKVKVFGAVGKAGQHYIKGDGRLLDVITAAGGVDFSTDSTRIFVLRKVSDTSKLAIEINLNDLIQGKDPTTNILLKDEDIIYIPRARRYMVMGEVNKPGIYNLDSYRKTSILEAIIQAGGFTPIAAKNKVWIYRVAGGKDQEIRVRVGDLMKGGRKQTVYIEENDTIIVPESLF